MKIEIMSCNNTNISKEDIGLKIIGDGNLEYGKCVNSLLQIENVAKNSVVAVDVSEITYKIIGVIIVEEYETSFELTLAYVMQRYRRKGVFKAMFENIKQKSIEKNKPIKFYCNRELCEIYEHCGCITNDNLAVMIFKKEKNNGQVKDEK